MPTIDDIERKAKAAQTAVKNYWKPPRPSTPFNPMAAALTPEEEDKVQQRTKPQSTTPPWRAGVLLPNKRFASLTPEYSRELLPIPGLRADSTVRPCNLGLIDARLRDGAAPKCISRNVQKRRPRDELDYALWLRENQVRAAEGAKSG